MIARTLMKLERQITSARWFRTSYPAITVILSIIHVALKQQHPTVQSWYAPRYTVLQKGCDASSALPRETVLRCNASVDGRNVQGHVADRQKRT